jgi:hypothetical protein
MNLNKNTYSPVNDRRKEKDEWTTKDKVMIGGLFLTVILLGSLIIAINSAYNGVSKLASPLSASISNGNLEATIKDAHLALKSVRHVTDKLDTDKLLKQWEHTNIILERNKIPWKELPQWRLFAQHALKNIVNELEKNPHMMSDMKETSKNILHSVHPIMEESREWRKGLRGALYSTAKSIVNLIENKDLS